MEYEESKQLLIRSLRSLYSTKACIFYGDEAYTAAELAKEIEDETEVGKKHIELCMEAMNKVDEILKNKPSKKWWQFWK
jgi:hypothetical protein